MFYFFISHIDIYIKSYVLHIGALMCDKNLYTSNQTRSIRVHIFAIATKNDKTFGSQSMPITSDNRAFSNLFDKPSIMTDANKTRTRVRIPICDDKNY